MHNFTVPVIKYCAIMYPLRTVTSVEPIIMDIQSDGNENIPIVTYIPDIVNQVFLGDCHFMGWTDNSINGLQLYFKRFGVYNIDFLQMNVTANQTINVPINNIFLNDIEYAAIVGWSFYLHCTGFRITFAP